VSPASPEPEWLRDSPLRPCVLWLEQQAFEIARRDPPLADDKLYLNDHGSRHIQAVVGFAEQLMGRTFIPSFSDIEKATLYAAALTHDLGLFRFPDGLDSLEVRATHARLSGAWVRDQLGHGYLTEDFARVLAITIESHARSVDITTVPSFARIPESPQLLRPRLLVAMLRIADSLDMGQSRTPIAIYRYYEGRIPARSAPYWAAHQLINDAELDLERREVLLHLKYGTDPADPDLRMLYTALQSEFDAIPDELWEVNRCVRLHVVFTEGDRRLAPGKVYADLVDRERARD